MPAPTSLSRAATHIDDAIEALTFDRFDWALEELAHGLAWLVDAQRTEPSGQIPLPAPGTLPSSGAMFALGGDAPPTCAALVSGAAALVASLDPEEHRAGCRARRAAIAQLIFDTAYELERTGRALGRPEEIGLVDVPTKVPPRGVRRREALQFLAGTGLVSLAACSRAEPVPETPPAAVADLSESPALDSAGVRAVTRLDRAQWPTSDPFLFCAYHLDDYPSANDNMGPAAALTGRNLGRDFAGRDGWNMYHGQEIPGFPRHPHRGFETVTVVRTGLLDHTDSLGATARYGGGDVQWLTAGGGIQHAEMFPLLNTEDGNPLELFQIWLNLPASDKMVPSHFTMLWNENIPRVTEEDAEGRATELTIVAGTYGDAAPPSPPPNSWASRPTSDLAIWKMRLDPGAEFQLPASADGTERSLYFHKGSGAQVGAESVANLSRVELEGPGPITITAGATETEILLLQARPIGEPVARRGPFVMNTQDEIQAAYSDYRETGFGGWPWTGDAPVHDRNEGRFALRADGVREEPG